MFQFYFLSIFLNLLVGFILIFGKFESSDEEVSEAPEKKNPKNPDEDISFLDTEYRGVKLPHQKKTVGGMFSKESVLNDKLFQLIAGLLIVFVSLVTFLSPVNGIPFLGDLIPSVAGIIGGAALLLEYYIENGSSELELPQFLQVVFVDYQKYIGVACVLVAVIHFIVPGVLFL